MGNSYNSKKARNEATALLLDILRDPNVSGDNRVEAYTEQMFAAKDYDEFSRLAKRLHTCIKSVMERESVRQNVTTRLPEVDALIMNMTVPNLLHYASQAVPGFNIKRPKSTDKQKTAASGQQKDTAPQAEKTVQISTDEDVDFRQEYLVSINRDGSLNMPQNVPVSFIKTNDVQHMQQVMAAGKYTQSEMRYMKAHLSAAQHLAKVKANKAHNKRLPAAEDVVISENGNVIRMPNAHMTRNQTGKAGCWSTALQIMLKSRGVDLPQEFIRAYRPNDDAKLLDADMDAELDADFHPTDYRDAGSSVVEHADVIFQTMPNTALRTKNYMFWNAYDSHRIPHQIDEKLISDRIVNDIYDAMHENRAPVGLLFGGHYRTIVGVDKQTGMISYKESMGNKPDATYQCSVLDIVQDVRTDPDNIKYGIGKGTIAIDYLKDLPVDEKTECTVAEDPTYRYVNGKLVIPPKQGEKLDANFLPTHGVRLNKGTVVDEDSGFEVEDLTCIPNEVVQLGEYQPVVFTGKVTATQRHWSNAPYVGAHPLPKIAPKQPEKKEVPAQTVNIPVPSENTSTPSENTITSSENTSTPIQNTTATAQPATGGNEQPQDTQIIEPTQKQEQNISEETVSSDNGPQENERKEAYAFFKGKWNTFHALVPKEEVGHSNAQKAFDLAQDHYDSLMEDADEHEEKDINTLSGEDAISLALADKFVQDREANKKSNAGNVVGDLENWYNTLTPEQAKQFRKEAAGDVRQFKHTAIDIYRQKGFYDPAMEERIARAREVMGRSIEAGQESTQQNIVPVIPQPNSALNNTSNDLSNNIINNNSFNNIDLSGGSINNDLNVPGNGGQQAEPSKEEKIKSFFNAKNERFKKLSEVQKPARLLFEAAQRGNVLLWIAAGEDGTGLKNVLGQDEWAQLALAEKFAADRAKNVNDMPGELENWFNGLKSDGERTAFVQAMKNRISEPSLKTDDLVGKQNYFDMEELEKQLQLARNEVEQPQMQQEADPIQKQEEPKKELVTSFAPAAKPQGIVSDGQPADTKDFISEVARLNERLNINWRSKKAMSDMREHLNKSVKGFNEKTTMDDVSAVLDTAMSDAAKYHAEKKNATSFSDTQIHRFKTINYLNAVKYLMTNEPPISPKSLAGQKFMLAVKITNSELAKAKPSLLLNTDDVVKQSRKLYDDPAFQNYVEGKSAKEIEDLRKEKGLKLLNKYLLAAAPGKEADKNKSKGRDTSMEKDLKNDKSKTGSYVGFTNI